MSRKRERLDAQPTKAKKARVRLNDTGTEEVEASNFNKPELGNYKNPLSKDRPGPGRPVGSVNSIPKKFTEAFLRGCEKHGSDGMGKDGLDGYGYFLAQDPKVGGMLIGRILPQRVQTSVDPQSVFGQLLESVRARIQMERARTINGNALPAPATRIG
jgi:hypothetical protein